MRVNALAFAAAVALGAMAAVPYRADAQGAPGSPPSVLSVNGEGVVTRSPDRATVSFEIVTSNDVAQTATSQNNATYANLRSRLAAGGIGESSVHTTGFAMNFVPKPATSDNASYRPPRTGYVVTRNVNVDVDNLDAVGRTIDAAVAAGVTNLGGVSYGLRDRRAAYASALAAAMKDAEAQATALAEAAHMKVGAIRSINAGGSFAPPPTPMFRTMSAAAMPAPTEIQPSSVDVRATVGVTYFLAR